MPWHDKEPILQVQRMSQGTPNAADLLVFASDGRQLFFCVSSGLADSASWSAYRKKKGTWSARCRIEAGVIRYDYEQESGTVDVYVLSKRSSSFTPPSVLGTPPFTIEAIEKAKGAWRRYGFRAPLPSLQNLDVFQWLVAAMRCVLTSPSDPARLEWVLRLARPEQGAFRRRLLERDGKCVVTGTTVEAVLQAAHIEDHASGGSMSAENGLLLRVDLHLLFDARLLEFKDEGGRLVVRFNERVLADPHYQGLEGKVVEGLPAEVSERLPGKSVVSRR